MRKAILIIGGGLLLFSLTIFLTLPKSSVLPPAPTEGILLKGEEAGHSERRRQWLESMHRAAPQDNWQQLEYERQLHRHQQYQQAIGRSDCDQVRSFANDHLAGRWSERGSINQAGSVYDTEYAPRQDRIWLISAGGTLWSGPRDGSDWRVEQQDLQFDRGMLRFVPLPNGRRLLAFVNSLPHFSDDDGQSWSAATGLPSPGRDADFRSPTLLDDLRYFVLYKPNFYAAVSLYLSNDRGRSFQRILPFDDHHINRYALCRPHHTDELFLANKTENGELQLWQWNTLQQNFVATKLVTPLRLGFAPANLVGGLDSLGHLQLYVYTETGGDYSLYRSDDGGHSWTSAGTLPVAPWEVGIYLSPDRSGTLYLGDIEAYRSRNGGKSWEKINEWWEYYDDITAALHADIMAIQEFTTSDKKSLTLISHHGGLSASYDGFDSQQNISLQGLNVSQYYSVRTDPQDPAYVYAGSQDQGMQRATAFTEGQPDGRAFEQLISGDYGQIVFTREGTAMWSVYPGGWVTYYDDPQTGNVTASYEVESENESVWLPPLMAGPSEQENVAYLAGGNIEGGPGSYIIRLEYRNGAINASQLPFDFKAESGGGEVTAMATAPGQPEYWYATTTNGRFFYSRDRGMSWEQSLNFVPEGHYLYGQAIEVSATDPEEVILAGSGYSNPPVYRSTDGGKNFIAMDEGMPPTLVFDLDTDPGERYLFAATEAGPYVYVKADQRWYDLSSPCTPAQTYWSVEYVPDLHIVRFGTYGRGIWDLQLEVDTPVPEPAPPTLEVKVFPNPSPGWVNVLFDAPVKQPLQASLWSTTGQKVWESTYAAGTEQFRLDVNQLPKGVYQLLMVTGAKRSQQTVILQ